MRSRIAQLWNKESSQQTLFDGIIAGDVASESDLAEVIVPSFNTDKVFCIAPWMPRGATFPSEGDRCIVGLGETDVPGTPEPWILAWWPYPDD